MKAPLPALYSAMPPLPQKLLKLLVCPVDKEKLSYDEKEGTLRCVSCKRCYSVRNGVPVMIVGPEPQGWLPQKSRT